MNPDFNMRVGTKAVIVRNDHLLVVAYDDETGFHYNLPGGGVEAGETIIEGLLREVREETCAEVCVGPLLLVSEYHPERQANRYGALRKLTLNFRCELVTDSEPRMPVKPDPNQIDVRWIPLAGLALQPLIASELLIRELPRLLEDPTNAQRFESS
jgi:ADP-ribose pyrophosphatase YjhB (NUDIX family)